MHIAAIFNLMPFGVSFTWQNASRLASHII
jgi:hypothetical protein